MYPRAKFHASRAIVSRTTTVIASMKSEPIVTITEAAERFCMPAKSTCCPRSRSSMQASRASARCWAWSLGSSAGAASLMVRQSAVMSGGQPAGMSGRPVALWWPARKSRCASVAAKSSRSVRSARRCGHQSRPLGCGTGSRSEMRVQLRARSTSPRVCSIIRSIARIGVAQPSMGCMGSTGAEASMQVAWPSARSNSRRPWLSSTPPSPRYSSPQRMGSKTPGTALDDASARGSGMSFIVR